MFSELKQQWNEKMGRETRIVDKPRVVLIDDDPMFGGMMAKTAENLALDFDFFESISGVDFIRQLADYDVIIVDNQMDHMSGMELAAYMPAFFEDKTVVLISSSDVTRQGEVKLPSFISGFIHKDEGCYQVLKQALAIHSA